MNGVSPPVGSTLPRRSREPFRAGLPAADPLLPMLVQSLSPAGEVQQILAVLHQLCTLTAWQEQNQRQAMELGAVNLVMQLLQARIPHLRQAETPKAASATAAGNPPSEYEDENTGLIASCLELLSNLSSNEDLAGEVALAPQCAITLVSLLETSCIPQRLTIYSARCLVNLTQCSKPAVAEALKAGLLNCAVKLITSNHQEHALEKMGCWLLANVTAPLGSSAREQLLQQPATLARLVQLARRGQSEPVVVLACNVLGNLVREEMPYKSQTEGGASRMSGFAARDWLAKAGALTALQEHAQAPDCNNKVLAAALDALSCLAMGHTRNAAALASQPGLAAALGLALEQRADAWTADHDAAGAVLAAHTLLHVLGHMLCNAAVHDSSGEAHGSAVLASPLQARQVVSLEGPDINVVDGAARVVVSDEIGPGQDQKEAGSQARAEARSESSQASSRAARSHAKKEVVYLSLATAAETLGVVLPVALPGAQKDGASMLTAIQAAEMRYRVTHVLLPRLRSPNPRAAATAAAALYHLAAACGGEAASAARRLMADSALVTELLHKLSSRNPPLMQASLAVLDVLSAEPSCGTVMLQSGWLAAITPLLESEDILVRRWADRALCSLFVAGGGHLKQR